MASINNVVLVGNLTKDIEVRKVGSDLSVTSFTLALNKKSKGEDTVDFISCQAWRQAADFLGMYAHKGNSIGVTGRLSTRNYEKDGHRVYITEVVCDTVQILERKGTSNEDNQQNHISSPRNTNNANNDTNMSINGVDLNSSDLPF